MLALSVVTAILAFVLSALVGHQARPIARALGLVDRPDPSGGRKLHARPTPLVGGLGIALSVCGAAVLSQLAGTTGGLVLAGHFGWLAFAVLAMFLIGAGDDRHQLSPRLRLGLSAIVLIVAMYFDRAFVLGSIDFDGFQPFSLAGWGGLFSLLCLIGLLNAVNMADGKNGLVIGLSLIWTTVLLVHAPDTLWPILAAAMSALAVLLWFNLHGRLFLGDGGSYGLSALFGLLAIDVYNQASGFHADAVIVMFIVPVLDTIRLMSLRVMHGKSPFDGDRNHFHHLLWDRFGWPAGLIVYLGLVGGTNLIAAAVPGTGLTCIALAAVGYAALMLICRRQPVVAES